jgi:predicted Holliday junction resolvase-like endonuclease
MILALLVLLVFVANAISGQIVHNLQGEVNQRQKFIQDSVALEALNREIVQALAQLSAKNGDGDLRKLLAAQGISFSVAPAPAGDGSFKSTK